MDRWGTAILRKSAIHEKNGVSIPNLKKVEDYTPEKYDNDIILWIPPKDCIRLEFEHNDYDTNLRCIRECASAANSLGFDYCITEHQSGKSPYFNMFKIKGLPLNDDNPMAKNLLIDLLASTVIKEGLDRSNLGWTYSPVIGHAHWKKKYNGAIHKIIRGKDPLEHENEYPKELLKQIKKSKITHKHDSIQVQQNYPWVQDFLLKYCTEKKLPVGNRNHIIEKNLAVLIVHRKDRDTIMSKYFKTQERKHNSLKGWFNKVVKGEIQNVSPGELKKYINDNNIPYEIPTVKGKPQEKREENEHHEKKAIEILKNPLLLIEIIKTVQDGGVCGEEDTILTLSNKINLRLVKGHKPTSSNTIVSDKTGAGKDVVTKAVCIVIVPTDKYYHRTGMSAKALDYWGTNKPEDWTWEGSVLYLEDPEEDCLKSQTFRVLSSGENKSSTVKDQELLDLDVKGKPVIIVTSMNATIDEEGGRRWDALRIDTTPELTKKVISNTLRSFSEGTKEKKDDVLQYALKNLLKPYEVVFPGITKLAGHMPSELLMRTQVNKFVDYIKSSAVLHQYQREKDEQGRLIATWFDYEYARFLFCKLRDMEGSALNVDEQNLIDVLREAGDPLSIKEVGGKFRRSVQWLYNQLDELKSKGLIRETYEFDEAANKRIQKMYSDFGYSSIDIPSSLVLNGFNSSCENQNKEGFNGFSGFNIIYEEINKLRKEQGLNEIKFEKNTTSQSNLFENRENHENLSVGGILKPIENHLKPAQYEKIQEIKKEIENNRKAGYTIDSEFLYKNFDHGLIDGLMRSDQLIKQANGEYVFGG